MAELSVVLHRDQKPCNILVLFEDCPRALIADFGLARYRSPAAGISGLAHEPMTGNAISNGYVPPELLSSRGEDDTNAYDSEVDVWSFGPVSHALIVESRVGAVAVNHVFIAESRFGAVSHALIAESRVGPVNHASSIHETFLQAYIGYTG